MFYDAFSRGVLALVGDVLDAILLAYTFSGEGELKNVVEYVFVEIWVVQMFLFIDRSNKALSLLGSVKPLGRCDCVLMLRVLLLLVTC